MLNFNGAGVPPDTHMSPLIEHKEHHTHPHHDRTNKKFAIMISSCVLFSVSMITLFLNYEYISNAIQNYVNIGYTR